jgi:3-deoxy-D-manno-oct-2-ulosonic acid (Kdo) hydroxylase
MEVLTVEKRPATSGRDYRPDLETGKILYFPQTPFDFPSDAREFLRSLSFSGHAIHKNIAYRTQSDRVTGIDAKAENGARLHEVMRSYSQSVAAFVRTLLPEYAAQWRLDYASFRPIEEHGRHLPLNKRNDLIHTDAFPSRPTYGDLILRVFTNIHPQKERVWITADPFQIIAPRYARDAGLERIAAGGAWTYRAAGLLGRLGLPVVHRSPYDRFMLEFHEYLKRNNDFQSRTPKYEFTFAPGSTWLCFTDIVPHSVKSGQHAVEQTFVIARDSLADRERAPISVLEHLCGKPLT